MGTWNSRGLRGSTLEDLINRSNDCYREKGLALIQKIPTPITPIEIDKTSRHITLAYFDQKSTVDYIGAVQGIPVCFDAKECATDNFPLQNIHEHQVAFMKDFERQQGIAFLILYFSHRNEIYYMTSRHITLAYFDQKSTVDYIGAVQGIPVCFDAKECSVTTFPLQNLHPHQVRFMQEFEKQGGIAFLILYYTGLDEIYYMPFQDVSRFWKRMEDGGRKSFTYEEVDKSWQIRSHRDILVHYLEQIARDLQLRDA